MSNGATLLTSQQAEGQLEKTSDEFFFDMYSKIAALSKKAKRPGEAIEVFHRSRERLENEITNVQLSEIGGIEQGEALATYHALLALVHWLYPNHVGYNRMKNAKRMYFHATTAAFKKSSALLPRVVGMVVQLRILPFLIRSKKSSTEQLDIARNNALSFVEENRGDAFRGLAALLHDALGFSYFLHERDADTALSYLSKSTELLITEERAIARTSRESSGSKLKFYRAFAATAFWDLGICYESQAEKAEGEQMMSLLRCARTQYRKSYDYAKGTAWHIYRGMSAYNLAGTFAKESQNQINIKQSRALMKKAVSLGEESLSCFNLWSPFEGDFLGGSWVATFYQQLANISDSPQRKRLMSRSLRLAHRAEILLSNRRIGIARYKSVNLGDIFLHNAEYHRQIAVQTRLQRSDNAKTIDFLNKSLESCLKSRKYYKDDVYSNRKVDSSLLAGDICYELMNCELPTPGRSKFAKAARRYFSDATKISRNQGWNEKVAESYWRIAQSYDREGNFERSASYYSLSHSSYELARASSDSPGLYTDPSNYMLAWERIERAKLAHKSSKFEDAYKLYIESAKLVESTQRWRTTSNLYRAEALIEKAEQKSVGDDPAGSVEYFSEAVQALARLRSDLKEDEMNDSPSIERLADQLRSFCNARMILEKSKEAYRIGDVDQSISGLGEAEVMFSELAHSSIVSDSLRSSELRSLASLCRALRSFQMAQKTKEPKLYLEAKEIFHSASNESTSRTLKPLLMGLASFADFLYYSDQIERSLESILDPEQIVECNKALDSAEVVFRRLKIRSFLNMLKASKHILDATIKMNAAEREMESASVKAKLYSEAQRSLSLASKYYEQLGSSSRVQESLRMIGTVRHHKNLLPLAHDIIAEIASNQMIYAAISTSSLLDQSPENSARDLNSAFLVVDIDLPKPFITQEQTLDYTLIVSNIGREPALTVRIDELIPDGFVVENGLGVKDRTLPISARIEPGTSKKIAVSVRAKSTGEFVWHPSLVYLDSVSNYKITRAQTVRAAIESSKSVDYGAMLSEKQKLEEELVSEESRIGSPPGQEMDSQMDKVYSLKERISKIEEELLRSKNEYEKMVQQLEQVKLDLAALGEVNGDNVREEDRVKLENEQRLLEYRIERRRSLLQQAHLL
ncbi:MAG: hypothetical protein JRN52_00300 [Nitrososphaerota archaeon]|nr:hypothetical protein [Nitrososphaerota archaeon]